MSIQQALIKISCDSDLETNDAVSSNSSNESKQVHLAIPIEIDVQPKRKIFNTKEEKYKFIQEYQIKWKTELCKNFLLKGECPYGKSCCFAHGYSELKTKTSYCQSYKTKPCKKYFLNGYCPYGYRCQYLHQDVQNCPQYYNFIKTAFKNKQISLDYILPNFYQNMLKYLEEQLDSQNFQRLIYFEDFFIFLLGCRHFKIWKQ